jgi:hypothetical protein
MFVPTNGQRRPGVCATCYFVAAMIPRIPFSRQKNRRETGNPVSQRFD